MQPESCLRYLPASIQQVDSHTPSTLIIGDDTNMETIDPISVKTLEVPLRSLLFVPGNHQDKIAKVFGYGADAVIIDLEDACATADKKKARNTSVLALKQPRTCRGYIRINGTDTSFCYGDLKEIVGPWLDGIVLPKLEQPEQLFMVDWLLSQIERECGIEQRSIDILPIIETGLGVSNLKKICAKPCRMRRFAFGAGDFTRDVGIKWSADESELAYVRSHMVLTARASGLEPPIDTVHIQLDDLSGYANSVAIGAKFGFQCKLLIHPKQVSLANKLFRPSEEDVEQARKVVAAFEASEEGGSASIQVDGYFVDYPIVEKAYSVIRKSELFKN